MRFNLSTMIRTTTHFWTNRDLCHNTTCGNWEKIWTTRVFITTQKSSVFKTSCPTLEVIFYSFTIWRGKRKIASNSIYTLEFVNYIDHIVDNLLNKDVISYSEKDSTYIKKVINIESKNHFDDLIEKKTGVWNLHGCKIPWV